MMYFFKDPFGEEHTYDNVDLVQIERFVPGMYDRYIEKCSQMSGKICDEETFRHLAARWLARDQSEDGEIW